MSQMPTKTFTSEEDEERFITVIKPMRYGFRKNMENATRPEKVRAINQDDIEMTMPDYDPNKDPDILILAEQTVEWSKEEELPKNRSKKKKLIKEDYELGDLFDEALEFLKKFNNLQKKDVVVECPECKKEFEVTPDVRVKEKN